MDPKVPEDAPLTVAALSLLEQHWYILLPLSLVLLIIKRRYLSPLRKYPGPFLASITRLHKFQSVSTGNTHLHAIELHRKYGPVVRIAPNEVSISSPEAARQLLSAGKGFHKTDFYYVFPPPENPDIFTEIRENVHAQKKRVANVPYSLNAMQQLAPFIDDTVDLLFSKLDGFANKEGKQVLDLGAWLHYFAFDVLGEVAFSRKFGFLEQGKDVEGCIKAIDDSQWYNGLIGQIPELDWLFRRNPLWKLAPSLSPANRALITRIATAEINSRKPFSGEQKEKADRQDLLSSLIKAHLKDPEKFGELDCFSVSHGAIFAGSDSTASTMQSFFYFVLNNSDIYKRLVKEVTSAVNSGALSETVQWNEAQHLPYFQACLKEAMRLRPAVGLNITRFVPPTGADIEGEHFPRGTTVAVNAWVTHRDAEIFGEDVEAFKPERWLEDEDEAKVMDRYMFQFGGGSHLCIGRNLALLEMNKVIPRLLQTYEFDLVHPGRELDAKATFFVVQEGLEVHVKRRDQ